MCPKLLRQHFRKPKQGSTTQQPNFLNSICTQLENRNPLPIMSETTVSARLESVIVAPTLSISDALTRLDKAGTGALVLCTADRKLVGLLSDGDIRRAILRSQTLEAP